MILVDIGNSGLRAARVHVDSLSPLPKVYRLSWTAAASSVRKASPEQEAAPDLRWCKLEDPFAFDWLISQFEEMRGETWFVSSVQRNALEQLKRSLIASATQPKIQVVSYADVPLNLDVLSPERTGVDRLLAAYYAYRHVNDNNSTHQPVIVVQAGTAVTVDIVDATGVFLGGAIMPGLGLSLQLLAAGTDQLPWLGNHLVDVQPTLPGRNTEQAISAGVNAALVGGASHLVQRYRSEWGKQLEIRVVVSGGDGQLLIPYIARPVELVEYAVLQGLAILANESPKRTNSDR